jgi:DNA-binding MarR family transcriptional regulator
VSPEEWREIVNQARVAIQEWPVLHWSRVVRRLLQTHDRALQYFDLDTQQFHIMCWIAMLEVPCGAEISRRLGIGEPGVSRILRRLKDRDLVRDYENEYGRLFYLSLSPSGRRLLGDALAALGPLAGAPVPTLNDDPAPTPEAVRPKASGSGRRARLAIDVYRPGVWELAP